MQILQMIAERAGAAKDNADLVLIGDLWPQRDRIATDMRSTERVAIRRAASSMDRVGAALTARLSASGTAAYRVLPTINPTTRVRKTPQRLWLDICLTGLPGKWTAQPVLFAEIQRNATAVGVRLPRNVDVLGKKIVRTVRRFNRTCVDEAEMWRLERKSLPGEQQDCSHDLNAWLSRRSVDTDQSPGHLTLSKLYTPAIPTMTELEADLTEAVTLFGNLLRLE